MKKLLITTGALTLTTVMLYAIMVVSVFSDKAYTTSEAASIDTSATISLHYYDNVNLVTAFTGSDSIRCMINVDGYYDGKWDLGVVTDSLIIDNGSGDYTKTTELRGVGVGVGGYEAIRIRNVLSTGAADDSSSALTYSQQLIGR